MTGGDDRGVGAAMAAGVVMDLMASYRLCPDVSDRCAARVQIFENRAWYRPARPETVRAGCGGGR